MIPSRRLRSHSPTWLQHTPEGGGFMFTNPRCVCVCVRPAGVEEEPSALGSVSSPRPSPWSDPATRCMDLWELTILCFTVVVLYAIQTYGRLRSGIRGRSAQAPWNRWNRSPKKG